MCGMFSRYSTPSNTDTPHGFGSALIYYSGNFLTFIKDLIFVHDYDFFTTSTRFEHNSGIY